MWEGGGGNRQYFLFVFIFDIESFQVSNEKKRLSSYGSVEQLGNVLINNGFNVNSSLPESESPTDNPTDPFLVKSTNPFASTR